MKVGLQYNFIHDLRCETPVMAHYQFIPSCAVKRQFIKTKKTYVNMHKPPHIGKPIYYVSSKNVRITLYSIVIYKVPPATCSQQWNVKVLVLIKVKRRNLKTTMFTILFGDLT